MKNKQFLLGLLVMVLAFGMTVVGCDKDGDDDNNPFVGDWEGSFTKSASGSQAETAKMNFTDDTWAITTGDDSATAAITTIASGTYTRSTFGANLFENGYSIANVVPPVLDIISVTLSGPNSGSGSFSRVKQDPFVGTWSGNYTITGQQPQTASIAFTADLKWTFTIGSTTESGTYEKKSLGYTATLNQGEYSNIGSCVVNPTDKTLRVSFTKQNIQGSGSGFTR